MELRQTAGLGFLFRSAVSPLCGLGPCSLVNLQHVSPWAPQGRLSVTGCTP